jgi:hypothetical protein
MLARSFLLAAAVTAGSLGGTGRAADADRAAGSAWRSADDASPPAAGRNASSDAPGKAGDGHYAPGHEPTQSADRPLGNPVVRATAGEGELPREHGQLWMKYDISPYTLRVTSTNRPELAIRDWILRETGYEVWHSEVVSILSVDRRTLRVYHTPEIQRLVADIVERFVSTEAETHAFGLRVVTLGHPSWRSRAAQLLDPVPVQTPGVEAWLLQKEDAALLLAELRRRPDYREHSSPHLLVNNGQSTVVSATRAREYLRGAAFRSEAWPGFEPKKGLIDEGFSLEFSPLLSADGGVIDAVIRCEINQVEKMIPVSLEVPEAFAPRQRPKIEVPQMSQFRFHERFRWPVDQVLLVGMGMVPLPVPSDGESLIPGLPLPLPTSAPRADLLVFVESRGNSGPRAQVTGRGRPRARTYMGRY